MPTFTIMQLRARAIFSVAFLGALRADTVISLRLGHIDCDKKQIIQDATQSRAKNGKSLVIGWFPLPENKEAAVKECVQLMKSGGFSSEDALFPKNDAFTGRAKSGRFKGQVIAPMTSTHAATSAFRSACAEHKSKYTPHSVKHAIVAERDRLRLTQAQRKAWSENMGHENEKITTSYYGKLPEVRRLDLIHGLTSEVTGSRTTDFTDAQKIALVDTVLQMIS